MCLKNFCWVLFAILLCAGVFAEPVTMHVFYGQGCQHCARSLGWVESVEDEFPELSVERYEVYFDADNQALFQNYSARLGHVPSGVPTFIINTTYVAGFNDEIGALLKAKIIECGEAGCVDEPPSENSVDNESWSSEELLGYGFIGVLLLGLVVFLGAIVIKSLRRRRWI